MKKKSHTHLHKGGGDRHTHYIKYEGCDRPAHEAQARRATPGPRSGAAAKRREVRGSS